MKTRVFAVAGAAALFLVPAPDRIVPDGTSDGATAVASSSEPCPVADRRDVLPHVPGDRAPSPAPALVRRAPTPAPATPTPTLVISGGVSDAQTGRLLQGVQVHIPNLSAGALSNGSGRYVLTLPDGLAGQTVTVEAALIGYGTESRTLTLRGGVNALDFSLRQQALSLDELVVTGRPDDRAAPGRRAEADRSLGNGAATPTTTPGIRLRGQSVQTLQAVYAPPADREAYAYISENVFRSPLQEPLSTFSIDVDRASYSNVRRFLNAGTRPPVDAVRIEELINYFPYSDPEPTGDVPFSVTAEVAPAPWQPAHHLVRIGLKGRSIDLEDAPPSNLVFLLDVSGSMSSPDKLPLLKTAFRMLVDQLRAEDRVAIVVYAGAAGLVLPSTPGCDRERILDALDGLQAGGSTAGGAGINLAYAVAAENFIEGGNNRVILATDGDFNVGASSDAEMIRLIEEKREQGTFLTVLGFGTGNLQDAKMEQIADHGNGNFAYIDGPLEARKVLVSEMGGTLVTIAKDVKIQVEFNPARVSSYRLIGYENRLLAAEDFNDDAKDAGELGAGHSVTALYEVVPVGAESSVEVREVDPLRYGPRIVEQVGDADELMYVKLRYKEPNGAESSLVTRRVEDIEAAGSDDFRFAAAVAAWGMLLRDSEHCGDFTVDDVARLARGALGADPGGYRADFIALLDRARSLEILDRERGMR